MTFTKAVTAEDNLGTNFHPYLPSIFLIIVTGMVVKKNFQCFAENISYNCSQIVKMCIQTSQISKTSIPQLVSNLTWTVPRKCGWTKHKSAKISIFEFQILRASNQRESQRRWKLHKVVLYIKGKYDYRLWLNLISLSWNIKWKS